jgi:hypothetical protein
MPALPEKRHQSKLNGLKYAELARHCLSEFPVEHQLTRQRPYLSARPKDAKNMAKDSVSPTSALARVMPDA